jgi:N utilization substance protein A
MKSDFLIALTQLAAERNLPRETVLSAIEAALISAYRKDSITAGQNISVKLDPGSGEVTVYIVKTAVEEVEDPNLELSLEEARKYDPKAEIGDSIATDSLPHSAGRIAAQTAKQVVLQRLREAERDLVFEEFADKEGEVFTVTIQRIESKQIIVEMGRGEAVLPPPEQVPFERYRVGQKMKMILLSVDRSAKGPELIVSRADKQLLRRLFEMEVPEIYNGAVEIKAIAREPGSRSKVAVVAIQSGVDPVGSCVGLRGIRIQNIVNELHGEKIDVVEWDKDPAVFISSSLSPSLVTRVDLDHETGSATATVSDRQLSLAIGREGQNARLSAKLTGWNVDIKAPGEVSKDAELAAVDGDAAAVATPEEDAPEEAPKVEPVEVEAPDEAQELPIAADSPAEIAATEAEAPVAEVDAGEAESEAAAVSADAEEAPVTLEQEAVPDLPPEVFAPELLGEPVAVTVDGNGQEAGADDQEPLAASLRDLPEDVWAVRRPVPVEPGQIRFAEDIVDLKGGVTARRGRKADRTGPAGKKRRSRPGGRRGRGVFRR